MKTYWLQKSYNQFGEFTRSTLWEVSAATRKGFHRHKAKMEKQMGLASINADGTKVPAQKRERYTRLSRYDVLPQRQYQCSDSGELLSAIAF